MLKDIKTGDILSVKMRSLAGFTIALERGFKGFLDYILFRFIATHSATIYYRQGVKMVDMMLVSGDYQVPLEAYLKKLKDNGHKYRIRRVGHLVNSSMIYNWIYDHKKTEYENPADMALIAIGANPDDIDTMMCSERVIRCQRYAETDWPPKDPENTSPAVLDKLAKKVARRTRKLRK